MGEHFEVVPSRFAMHAIDSYPRECDKTLLFSLLCRTKRFIKYQCFIHFELYAEPHLPAVFVRWLPFHKVNRDLFAVEVYKFNQFLTDKWTSNTINTHIFLLISLHFYKRVFFRLLGNPDLLCSEIAFSFDHFSNSLIKWSEVNLTSTLTIPRKITQL